MSAFARLMFLVCAFAYRTAGAVDDAPPALDVDYIRGYVQAVLDLRRPGVGGTQVEVDAQGRVEVTGDACPDDDERVNIERILFEAGIREVAWSLPECRRYSVAVPQPEPSVAPFEDVTALPSRDLFKPLLADPREPQFGIKYHYYDTAVQNFNAGNVTFGDYFGFANWEPWRQWKAQVGIQGAVFALFNLDADSTDLVNADYWVGIPVDFRRGDLSLRLNLHHQSSHLGDEFLLGNEGVNRINLSFEAVRFLAAYDLRPFRLYGGGGYILRSEPHLGERQAQWGLEYVRHAFVDNLDLILAADLQAAEELDWDWNRSYQAGLGLYRNGRRLRLMLEHYRGHSPNGQFYRDRLRYTGIGLYFDL